MSGADMDSSAYVEVKTFTSGHCDTVNALSFSPDGTYLASGGDDCSLLVWNIPRERLTFRILFNGPISCIVWHPIYADTLIVGCDDGKIVQIYDFSLVGIEQYDIRIGVRSEVHCLEYDAQIRCLAIGIGNEVHITREQDRNTYTGDIVLPAPSGHGPAAGEEDRLRAVAVHFINGGRKVVVSYLVHGIICYDVQSGEQYWAIASSESPKIGSSALSRDGRSLIVYGFERGVRMYSLDSRKNDNPINTYELEQVPRTKHRVQVAFVQKDRGIVCGTTTGNVCVWYRESREIFQKLHHADGMIQAVATVDRAPFSYIATGSVEQGQTTKIKLWRAKMKESPRDSEWGTLVSSVTVMRVRQNIVCRCLKLAYYPVLWVGVGLALAWAFTQMSGSTVEKAFKDAVAFIAAKDGVDGLSQTPSETATTTKTLTLTVTMSAAEIS